MRGPSSTYLDSSNALDLEGFPVGGPIDVDEDIRKSTCYQSMSVRTPKKKNKKSTWYLIASDSKRYDNRMYDTAERVAISNLFFVILGLFGLVRDDSTWKHQILSSFLGTTFHIVSA